MTEEEEKVVNPYSVLYEGQEETVEYLTEDGKAKVCYGNKDVYNGEYVNGLRHGNGMYEYNELYNTINNIEDNPEEETKEENEEDNNKKITYNGIWEKGLKTGTGELKYPDGSIYKGEFLNNKRHGEGTYYYSNGDIFCGHWENNKKIGQGSYKYEKDGVELVGEWDINTGNISSGEYIFGDKKIKYIGKFNENGEPNGEGKYVFPDRHDNRKKNIEIGEYEKGIWKQSLNSVTKPLPYIIDEEKCSTHLDVLTTLNIKG